MRLSNKAVAIFLSSSSNWLTASNCSFKTSSGPRKSSDGVKVAKDAAIGGTTGKFIPNVKVSNITSGNGSFAHVAATTAGKAVVAETVSGSGQRTTETAANAVMNNVKDTSCLNTNPHC